MQSVTPRIALITGANKGIGLELARQVGKAGHRVLLGARAGALVGSDRLIIPLLRNRPPSD
jgi:NAD(P)-dependent dehydrogenase (short-subunit alcohol dehydrogenase family)